MSLYLGENLISGQTTLVGESRNIGQIIPSAIPLTDAGLHLLDGALIQGSGTYSAFVDYIAGLDLTANYFCTESEWQASVTQYGVCGKFVYDATANTVRLPKVTGIIEGTTDVSALGDLVEAGLPNITGTFSPWAEGNRLATGAFYVAANNQPGNNQGGDNDNTLFGFDASRASSIYGNSLTVQPQTIKAFYYIVIATSTKTDIQVDIDEIATDLNGKADVDLSNISASQSAKNEIISWGMPDYSAGISKPSSGFTADEHGWLYINSGSRGYAVDVFINGLRVYNSVQSGSTSITITSTDLVPVRKGDVITSTINQNGNLIFTFYPLKGAN